MASPETTPILLALPSFTPSLALEVTVPPPAQRIPADVFLQVLPYGLTIHRFFVQADGRVRNKFPPLHLPFDLDSGVVSDP